MGFISLMSEKCSRLPTSRRRAYGVNSYQLLDVFTSELVRLPPFYLLVRLTPPLVFGLCSHLGSRLRVLVRLALLVCLPALPPASLPAALFVEPSYSPDIHRLRLLACVFPERIHVTPTTVSLACYG